MVSTSTCFGAYTQRHLLDVRKPLRQRPNICQLNYGRDRFTEFFIWNSNCDRIENRWWVADLFDFFENCHFHTRVDAHRAPPKQRDRTVIFNNGEVLGGTLAIDDEERTRSFCFVFVVAEWLTTSDRKPPVGASARRQDVVVLVNHHNARQAGNVRFGS